LLSFSRLLGSVVDCINVNPSARVVLALRDAQKVCALTIVGTVLKVCSHFIAFSERLSEHIGWVVAA